MRVTYQGETKQNREVDASSSFSVQWQVMNAGKEVWEKGVKFVRVTKNPRKMELLGGMEVLVEELAPGATQEITLALTAPSEGGKYKAWWMLVLADGSKFGKRVSLKAYVLPSLSASPSSLPSSSSLEKEGGRKRGARSKRGDEGGNEEERDRKKVKTTGSKDEGLQGVEEWPEDVTHLFLDGNNMLFVPARVRAMVLKRARGRAEIVLEHLSLAFLKKMHVANCTLIYDHTRTYREHNIPSTTQGEGKLTVCSATRSHHKISDDAIADWIADLKHVSSSKLVVTSDRGLITRVQEAGGCVMKPGRWMRFAASIISGENIEKLDEWMDEWISKEEQQLNTYL